MLILPITRSIGARCHRHCVSAANRASPHSLAYTHWRSYVDLCASVTAGTPTSHSYTWCVVCLGIAARQCVPGHLTHLSPLQNEGQCNKTKGVGCQGLCPHGQPSCRLHALVARTHTQICTRIHVTTCRHAHILGESVTQASATGLALPCVCNILAPTTGPLMNVSYSLELVNR